MTQRAFGHRRPGHFGQPTDYADTATAYQLTDIPENAITAKKQALHFLNPDILELNKKPWNNLTKPSGPFAPDHGPHYKGMPFAPRFPDPCHKRTLSIGTSIKAEIDYRAEKLPKRDPILPTKTSKLQFDPRKLLGDKVPANLGGTGLKQSRTDTTVPPGKAGLMQTRFVVDVDVTGALDMKEAWNPSTEKNAKWRVANYNQQLETARINSKRRELDMTKGRQSLRQTYLKNVTKQREEKKIQALKEGDFEDYLASLEKLKSRDDAMEQEASRQRELDRMELVYSKEWKGKDYYCDGIWGYNTHEGRYCWSCCGSYVQDGPGCQPRKKAGTGWNFASIN
mmetsp:Transcript_11413/g.22975  ORF Transcript_11413/g.22975 Transcript_11413/m.22975 type:complete len:339 (+) Transcript_11413:350-1366(+)|eukprot:CAMPEP_0181345908 /NCGR_PEP_ID=MMETSP1101-20121128/33016_1 /TAXON_ID=46948 /ORGANISM="Rhodomonas abbreviata, Strain Caron Lab Isolate" /LENGTH=338 /DNA_ID=CAMNT_0023457927 /DNA_START=350 /DNA_END=1366 /DNA_ORIENTATION=-